MKQILLIGCASLSLLANAQTDSSQSSQTPQTPPVPATETKIVYEKPEPDRSGTLTVTGYAEEMLQPDIIICYIDITATANQTAKGIAEINETLAKLKTKLAPAGIKPADLVLAELQVTPYYTQKEGKFDYEGYHVTQTVMIKLEGKREKMESLMNILSGESNDLLTVHFVGQLSVERKREAEKRLVKEALKLAKENAETVAAASELTLEEIREIQYNAVAIQTKASSEEASTRLLAVNSPTISKEHVVQDASLREIKMSKEVTVRYRTKAK
ncbi:MAG: SIMPL domain-containing protein [Bacteroidia bacterium]|nr:SIMPL domain-containing protein [Bacteroidia bacterium]